MLTLFQKLRFWRKESFDLSSVHLDLIDQIITKIKWKYFLRFRRTCRWANMTYGRGKKGIRIYIPINLAISIDYNSGNVAICYVKNLKEEFPRSYLFFITTLNQYDKRLDALTNFHFQTLLCSTSGNARKNRIKGIGFITSFQQLNVTASECRSAFPVPENEMFEFLRRTKAMKMSLYLGEWENLSCLRFLSLNDLSLRNCSINGILSLLDHLPSSISIIRLSIRQKQYNSNVHELVNMLRWAITFFQRNTTVKVMEIRDISQRREALPDTSELLRTLYTMGCRYEILKTIRKTTSLWSDGIEGTLLGLDGREEMQLFYVVSMFVLGSSCRDVYRLCCRREKITAKEYLNDISKDRGE